MNWFATLPPLVAWIALELTLRMRDLIRGKGSTAGDRGTRNLIGMVFAVAFGGAVAAAVLLRSDPFWLIGSGHLIAGVLVMWVGLGIRLWAILVLGREFRLTVEVDSDQPVVDRGPYRFVRHPSYTGLLILAIGVGLVLGDWLSLGLLVLLPPVGILRRIAVEEATLAEVLGQPYRDYQARTKRLIPGIW